MKLFMFFIIILAFYGSICACKSGSVIDIMEMGEITMSEQPIIQINALFVYETSRGRLVIIKESTEQKYAIFDNHRQSCFCNDLELIKNEDFSQYLGRDYSCVQESIGKPHLDVGSGFFIPAYITEDAYLICFGVEKNKVVQIGKMDLLSNKLIEKWAWQNFQR